MNKNHLLFILAVISLVYFIFGCAAAGENLAGPLSAVERAGERGPGPCAPARAGADARGPRKVHQPPPLVHGGGSGLRSVQGRPALCGDSRSGWIG